MSKDNIKAIESFLEATSVVAAVFGISGEVAFLILGIQERSVVLISVAAFWLVLIILISVVFVLLLLRSKNGQG